MNSDVAYPSGDRSYTAARLPGNLPSARGALQFQATESSSSVDIIKSRKKRLVFAGHNLY